METPPPDFSLLYDDTALLIVNKPTRLLSVPGRGPDKQDCLVSRIQAEFPDALIVHRLDYDTSGLLVLARGKAMHRELSILFQERQVTKRYVAVVDGKPDADSGEVNLPLIVDWPNRPRQMVDHAEGRPAVTDWRVVRASDDETRIRLMPLTGRSHQLRVHMAEIGHPILGDPLYATGAAADFPRLMLHAESLRLKHPESGLPMTFSAPAEF